MAALFGGEQDPDDWRAEALCAQIGGDDWFPEQGGLTREAKRVCGGCPVRAECLEFALANSEAFGVWGGLSERERRPLVNASRISRELAAAELMANGEKRCRTCQKLRPVGEFYRNSSTSDELKASCKGCCEDRRARRRSIPRTSQPASHAA